MLGACSTTYDRLDYDSLSVGNDQEMAYGVYTPPDWTPDESLPLVLFLHGGGSSHKSFEKFKASDYLDREIREGNIPRFVLLTPNGNNGFWENWHDGSQQYRDWVMLKLLPKIQRKYNTQKCPEHCHLLGISMGGFGALRFAYFFKDHFSSISAVSAPIPNQQEVEEMRSSLLTKLFIPMDKIFGPKAHADEQRQSFENAWLQDEDLHDIRLQLVWGDKDRKLMTTSNARFVAALEENNIPVDYFIYSGGHKWKYWVPSFDKILNFLVGDRK